MVDGGGITDSDDDLPLSHKRTKLNRAITNGKEAEEDRLSALPDCLLLHILSFLRTKEVVRTCLLSKRWEFIWTGISEIDLRDDSYITDKTHIFVDWVGRILAMCKDLKKFSVDFKYENSFASNVNFWVYFAIKNKIKDITLRLKKYYESYELPQMLYSYSSLTNLNLYGCVMAPRGIIAWGSLKSLCIERVKLLDCPMEKILSGCPVLEVLHIKSCSDLGYLNIYSPNLTTLLIEDYNTLGEPFPDISAPYLRVLSIFKDVGEDQLKLSNVSSVVEANLDYYGVGASDHSTINHLKQLLESLRSVKKLELGPRCLEVVSVMEINRKKLPLSTRRCLTLNVYRHEMSIFSIVGMLRSSSNLETLLIRGSWDCDNEKMEDLDEYEITLQKYKRNMDFDAFHLKTVMITHFTEQDLAGEPMLTLIRVLLKSAKVLEKMVISVHDPSSDTSVFSTKIAKNLLTFTRASPKAVLVLN